MVNLLGADGFTGDAHYAGLKEVMALPGVNLHLYGKTLTKPYRKMGHATILGENTVEAKKIAKEVQQKLVIRTV